MTVRRPRHSRWGGCSAALAFDQPARDQTLAAGQHRLETVHFPCLPALGVRIDRLGGGGLHKVHQLMRRMRASKVLGETSLRPNRCRVAPMSSLSPSLQTGFYREKT